MSGYLPILVFFVLAAAFGVVSLVVAAILAPRRPTPAKSYPYECGIIPERLPKGERFPVKFYVVAMIFIIFDIETIFMFPWAVSFRQLGLFGLLEMALFIGLVFIAYVYVWKKGGLDWGEPVVPGAEKAQARRLDAEARAAKVTEVARAG